MPTDQDYNLFRRYIGDFNKEEVDEDTIDDYLDDATAEATAPHTTPDNPIITQYDLLPQRYSPEVVLLAAINWWWNKAGEYADRITTTVGQASEQATDRWEHAMSMISSLQTLYDSAKALGQDPDLGDLSYWDRNALMRVGGASEEDIAKKIIPNWGSVW